MIDTVDSKEELYTFNRTNLESKRSQSQLSGFLFSPFNRTNLESKLLT